jgi:hypothetical protein
LLSEICSKLYYFVCDDSSVQNDFESAFSPG